MANKAAVTIGAITIGVVGAFVAGYAVKGLRMVVPPQYHKFLPF